MNKTRKTKAMPNRRGQGSRILLGVCLDDNRRQFDVERSHGIAEQHYREDEPWRRAPQRLLGYAARVERRRSQVINTIAAARPVGDE